MSKKKSPRNKTIDISVEEGRHYLERCISLEKPVSIEEVKNKTIWGDTFKVIPLLPPKSVDLVIVDPPYNLTKQYHGRTFQKKKSDEYREFTAKWLDLVLPLLKDNGSIYICCDWQSSLIIGQLLMDRSIVRNRITWQREKEEVPRPIGKTAWRISGMQPCLMIILLTWKM